LRGSSNSAFDLHADNYDLQCHLGLALSGETKQYFARGRIAFLRDWWTRNDRREPSRIVDLGCGLGDVTPILSDTFPFASVLGLDPSPKMIEYARSKFATDRVAFEAIDETSELEATCDLVHLNGVVHHVAPENRSDLFARIRALMRQEAIAAIFENNPLNPGTRMVMARIPFDRDACTLPFWKLKTALREAEFVPIVSRHLFYFPRALRFLRPLEGWLGQFPFGAQYAVLAERLPEP